MGAVLHGFNGVNPKTSIHVPKIYVIPRLLCDLDAVRLSVSDMKPLSTYFTRLLKQLQNLSERTATAERNILTGQLPIESVVHKRMLTLFSNNVREPGSVERDIAMRKLAVEPKSSNSWFVVIAELCSLFSLP